MIMEVFCQNFQVGLLLDSSLCVDRDLVRGGDWILCMMHPTTIANAADGGGRLFIVEQGGKIKILYNGRVLPTPFLDISRL